MDVDVAIFAVSLVVRVKFRTPRRPYFLEASEMLTSIAAWNFRGSWLRLHPRCIPARRRNRVRVNAARTAARSGDASIAFESLNRQSRQLKQAEWKKNAVGIQRIVSTATAEKKNSEKRRRTKLHLIPPIRSGRLPSISRLSRNTRDAIGPNFQPTVLPVFPGIGSIDRRSTIGRSSLEPVPWYRSRPGTRCPGQLGLHPYYIPARWTRSRARTSRGGGKKIEADGPRGPFVCGNGLPLVRVRAGVRDDRP